MNTIAWIGFSQSLFAAILMFTKNDRSLSDKILSGWLILLSIEFLTCGLDYEFFKQPLLSSSFLLFNPALYLYISSLTRPSFHLKWVQLFHLLPFVVFELYAYLIQEPFEMDTYFVRDENFLFRMSFAAANFISWGVYNPLSLILVHKYRMHLHNEQSNIEKNESLGWVLAVGIFYVVYCIFAFIIAIIVYYSELQADLPYVFNYSVLLFIIFVLSFYGLRQQVLPKQLLIEKVRIPYEHSNLSGAAKKRIEKKVLDYFENEKAYLNPDLNMELLSQTLKIPKHQITEVLNTVIGKNFFQFVNTYRVEAVKQMLLDPKNKFSIEAVGYDCGFSSKSSFYTVFKSITGVTPVAFKNKSS
ncbi:MAG: helix-turn-helix domain-containing protein [Paludibacter sp.]|nr:helix-turn-helix domain-containing protein [Paludibacter sp.]